MLRSRRIAAIGLTISLIGVAGWGDEAMRATAEAVRNNIVLISVGPSAGLARLADGSSSRDPSGGFPMGSRDIGV